MYSFQYQLRGQNPPRLYHFQALQSLSHFSISLGILLTSSCSSLCFWYWILYIYKSFQYPLSVVLFHYLLIEETEDTHTHFFKHISIFTPIQENGFYDDLILVPQLSQLDHYNIVIRKQMDYKTVITHRSPLKSIKEEYSVQVPQNQSGKHSRNIEDILIMQNVIHSSHKHGAEVENYEGRESGGKYENGENYKQQGDTHDSCVIEKKQTQWQNKQKVEKVLDMEGSGKKSAVSNIQSQQQSMLLDSESSLKHSNPGLVSCPTAENKIYHQHQSMPYAQVGRQLYRTDRQKQEQNTKPSLQLSPSYISHQQGQSFSYSYSISIDQSIKLIKNFPSHQNQGDFQHDYSQNHESPPTTRGLELSRLANSRNIFPIKELLEQDEDYQYHWAPASYEDRNQKGKSSYGALWLDKVVNTNRHIYDERGKMKLVYHNESQLVKIVRNIRADYHRWDRQDQQDSDHNIFNAIQLLFQDIPTNSSNSIKSANISNQIGEIKKIKPKLSQSIQSIQITQQNPKIEQNKQQPIISVKYVVPTIATSQPINPLNRMRSSGLRSRNGSNSSESRKQKQNNINYVSMMDQNVVNAEQQSPQLCIIDNTKGRAEKECYLSTIYNIRTENSEDDGQLENSNNTNTNTNKIPTNVITNESGPTQKHPVASILQNDNNTNQPAPTNNHPSKHMSKSTNQSMNSNNQYPILTNIHTFCNNVIYNYAPYAPHIPQQPHITNPLPNYEPCLSIDRNNNLLDTGNRNNIMIMHRPGGTGIRMDGTNAQANRVRIDTKERLGQKIKIKLGVSIRNQSKFTTGKNKPENELETVSKQSDISKHTRQQSKIAATGDHNNQQKSRGYTSISQWCCDSQQSTHTNNSSSTHKCRPGRSGSRRFLSLSRDKESTRRPE